MKNVADTIRKTAQITRKTARFCLNPFCLHVAGEAKCKMKCCKTKKG